ncbi:hypothetical protein [Natrinema altunense]|uniref:Uncharacterized protein n=1 Tax=Natrinema altunense TaxID=222984 RepID=A0A482Y4A0_9EURY|nr:hypothetical protein [Natrinema altunense]RZH69253.1 hypothetical protein ELS17_07400 [Natrinema altunense]
METRSDFDVSHVLEQIEKLKEENKMLKSKVQELEKRDDVTDSRLRAVNRSLENLENKVEDIETTRRLSSDIEATLSPIEYALIENEDYSDSAYLPRKKHVRAANIVAKFQDWSVRTKRDGERIRVKDEKVKELYNEAYGESLSSKQLSRVFSAVEALSDSKIIHRTDSGHELFLPKTEALVTNMDELKELSTNKTDE